MERNRQRRQWMLSFYRHSVTVGLVAALLLATGCKKTEPLPTMDDVSGEYRLNTDPKSEILILSKDGNYTHYYIWQNRWYKLSGKWEFEIDENKYGWIVHTPSVSLYDRYYSDKKTGPRFANTSISSFGRDDEYYKIALLPDKFVWYQKPRNRKK